MMESLSTDVMADRGVAAAYQKLQNFNADLTNLERQITESNSRLTTLQNNERRGPIERAAKALVGGASFKDIEREVAALQGDYPKLCNRRAVVAQAIELQKKALRKEETRASFEICEKVEPEYRAIVASLAKCVITLGKASMSDIDFFDRLRTGGISHPSLRRMNVTALGDPRDRNSRFAIYLMDCITFGLIDEAMVPADWKAMWEK